MRIQDILEGDYQDLRQVNNMFPRAVQLQQLKVQWGPKMQRLQTRCTSMLNRVLRACPADYQASVKGTQVEVSSVSAYAEATPESKLIRVDVTVFWDAPDDTLAFVIAHELGHIALSHTVGYSEQPPEQSRTEEQAADDFAVTVCKRMGLSSAVAFKFMTNKKAEYEEYERFSSQPDSTHPTYQQRIDSARSKGFKLSKGGLDQLGHMLA